MHYYLKQYELVKGARNTLLNYCETIQVEDLLKPIETFGKNSIRNLLVHNANVYLHWIVRFAQKRHVVYYKPEEYNNIADIKKVYGMVNEITES